MTRLMSEFFTTRERFTYGIVAIGIVLLIGYYSLDRQHKREYSKAAWAADKHSQQIYNQISKVSSLTASLSVLHQVASDGGSDQLDVFTQDTLNASELILSIGRFDRVSSDELHLFTEQMQERGIYNFSIKGMDDLGAAEELKHREFYDTVVSIYPFTPTSSRLVGVDISTDSSLDTLLKKAIMANESIIAPYPNGWPGGGDLLVIHPTYAGRYIPTTDDSRENQANGGFFLEIDLNPLLMESIDQSLTIAIPSNNLLVTRKDTIEKRFFTRVFKGYKTRITPSIGVKYISIEISSSDGVTTAAIYKSMLAMLMAMIGLISLLLLVKAKHESEHRRRTTQTSLESERANALTTLEAISDSVLTVDLDGHISYVNHATEMMLSIPSSQLIGQNLREILPIQDKFGSSLYTAVMNCFKTKRVNTLTDLKLEIGRDSLLLDATISPFSTSSDEPNSAVLALRDVGQERALTKKLEFLATHDSLTGLSNRYLFEMRLGELITSATETGSTHAVCYIDLDQFKIVNDTCGHKAGDQLLLQVSNSLKSVCRDEDTLSRLGGDEFGILIKNCSEEEAESIAKRLHDHFQTLFFTHKDHRFAVRASIGFVAISEQYVSISDVLAAADIACYSAKDKGRNELHIFRASCEETTQRRGELDLLPKLQNALAVDKFVLFVQPIAQILPDGLDPHSKYEILLRMQDVDGTLITPFRLISAAERYDLMRDIDRWVINKAFHSIAELHQIYGDDLPMFSINLSGQSTVDSELIGYIMGKIAQTNVPTNKLCFEITETSAIADLNKALVLLDFLHDLGCKLALDDFGAGVSSFGYLKNLPVDYLKVDGQFVRDLDTCEVHREMVRFVQQVAKLLGMKTVAEFVETQEIVDCLRDMSIDYAQGYHISKPYPIEALKESIMVKKAA